MNALRILIAALTATFMIAASPGHLTTDGRVQAAAPEGPTAAAERLGREAREAYKDKRFEDAIELYLRAHGTRPAADFLYNVGFIYDRKLGEPELARDYYERVLRAPDATEQLKARALAKLGELSVPPVDDPPPIIPPPVTTPPVTPPPPSDPAPNLVPWLVMGGGGLVLATGVVFGVLAAETHADYEGSTDARERSDLASTGKTQAVVADVMMITGAVGIGVGVVLFLIDQDDDEGAQGVHVSPAAIPGGAMVTIGGSL